MQSRTTSETRSCGVPYYLQILKDCLDHRLYNLQVTIAIVDSKCIQTNYRLNKLETITDKDCSFGCFAEKFLLHLKSSVALAKEVEGPNIGPDPADTNACT